jgi:predicted transposase/invertase (TIGR01784 family)
VPQLLAVTEDPTPYVPQQTTRHIHDSGYKHLLSNKRTFLEFLRRFVPHSLLDELGEINALDDIDAIDELELLSVNSEFIKKNLSKTTADLIYRVRNRAQRTFYFILLELQSTIDLKMGLRLFESSMEQWRRSIHELSDSESSANVCALPMIVPIVLYNGKAPWRNPQTVILDFFRASSRQPLSVNFEYAVVDVHRLSEGNLTSASDVISSAFYLDQTIDTNPAETIRRLRFIAQQMQTFNDEQYKQVMIWLSVKLSARIGARRDEINDIFQQTERGEESAMIEKVQNAWQKQIEEVRLAGEQDGMQKGMQQGLQQGLQQGKKELALQLLRAGLLDVTTISQVTGISEHEIRSWMQ